MSDRNAEMVRMYIEDGLTQAAIGAHFGVSRQRVQSIMDRAGVTRRDTLGVIAGRRERRRRYSDDDLLVSLRRVALQVGKTPGAAHLGTPWPSHMTYAHRFGSLSNAQVLAGLTPNVRGSPGHNVPLPQGFREQWGHLAVDVKVPDKSRHRRTA